MTTGNGPVYEVTLCIEPQVIEPFDHWLEEHIRAMLELPGFVTARVFELEDDEQGRARRVTQYFLESEADLERYLAGPAATMRQAVTDRFAGQFEASRRVLRPTDFEHGEIRRPEHCRNCGTILSGQYCANCGQRARSRLISIWELTRDAFGDLFELDSRIWRTLVPLFTRPGKLTRDYLEGRRARFMPPFRTYLVLSIFFFLVAFFEPREELGILFEPQEPVAEEGVPDGDDSAPIIPGGIVDEPAGEGVASGDETVPRELEQTIAAVSSDPPIVFPDDDDDGGDCDLGDLEEEEFPDWLAKRLTRERLQLICGRLKADDGKAFLEKMLDNVPAGLFILLPLMALVLKLLYPLSKRYYVEHLLFVVHYHAFVFLILTLQILLSRLGVLTGLPESLVIIALVATSLYIPVYLYKAMRRVYEQGRALTAAKYVMLTLAYFTGFTSILTFAALFAAFSI